MSTIATLTDLGLSAPEANIYLTLLKIGGSTASAVAQSAGIKRTTVYAILKSLAQKGFVTLYYRRSRQLYYAERPERVRQYFEKKIETFESLIPALEAVDKTKLQMIGLRFIETLPELKRFYGDILEEYKNKEYCVIGSAGAWQNLDPGFFIQYRKDRAKANIHTKILLSHFQPEASPADPKLLRAVKFLPKKYKFKSTIDIYKDKILIISPELTSLAIVIQVPAMTDVFKSIFELLWELLPKK
ncbi:MAG: hypothetical protein HYV42_01510 [Candidatus Magasanikbacteria bacterium]|nr:hypothetical protein [Candidatus Magasanikbacteria bacterium]